MLSWSITLAALVGLWRLRRVHPISAAFFLTIWMTYPVLYYFAEATVRYRYPIDWTFLVLAAYAVHTWISPRAHEPARARLRDVWDPVAGARREPAS